IPVRRPCGVWSAAPAAPEGPRRSKSNPVGRVLTRLPFRQSPVGRVLTRRSFADIKIKSFRAVTARATYLCLCKETWRKESTPRLRARCCAPGPRSRRDFPSGHPVRAENAAHPCAAPLRGLVRRLRRSGGAPEVKVKIKVKINVNVNVNVNGNGNRVPAHWPCKRRQER